MVTKTRKRRAGTLWRCRRRLRQTPIDQSIRDLNEAFAWLPKSAYDGDIAFGGQRTLVSLVRWEADDPPAAGVPSQQTLERLVCAAIVAAYPDRGSAVDNWLQSRPDPPQPNPKETAWSYMAGWCSEAGCEAFYRVIWEDRTIRDQLEARLTQSGAWRVAAALAE